MLIANYWTEHWDPNGGVRGKTEGAEGVCNPIGRTTILTNQSPPELSGAKTTNQKIHMAPATYVAEDGFIWHQWEEKPFVLWILIAQCRVILEK